MYIWIITSELLSGWRTYFRISYKVGLLAKNSLSFYFSVNVFISPSFLKDSFAGYKFLFDSFLLSALRICHLIAFSLLLFLMMSQLLILLRFSCKLFSLDTFKSSLCLCLSSFFLCYAWVWISLCLFILLGIHWATWIMQINVFHQILNIFSHYSIFFCSFLTFPSGIPITHMHMLLYIWSSVYFPLFFFFSIFQIA